jgi:hypothetical protein
VELWCRKALVVFTYLITKDIVETLERKIGLTLNNETKCSIRCIENEFLDEFWQFIPDTPEKNNKVSINANIISKILESFLENKECPVVSLDRVYCSNADYYLEVARITDPSTNTYAIAARPNNPTIDEQLKPLKKYREIILCDVGAFEGDTILQICNKIEQQGIKIKEIYLAFSSNSANKKINNNRTLKSLFLYDFYEWIELRDFFGIDGRIVQNPNNERVFIPYWENLKNWASIPITSIENVKELCIKKSKDLYNLLIDEGINTEKIGKRIYFENAQLTELVKEDIK